MKKNILEICIWVFIFAFLLNFLWESLHSPAYYMEGYSTDFNSYLRMLLVASSIDAIIIVAVFLGISLMIRDTNWLFKHDKIYYLISSVLGLVIAAITEFKSVYLQGKWDYNELMPVVPFIGIGILPLLQLMILIPLSFWLAKKHLS